MNPTSKCVVLEYTEEDRINILKNWNLTEEDLKELVENVQHWMKSQPHLPEIAEVSVVEKFLLMNKFNADKTKEKINMYYILRSAIPELFKQNPNDAKFQEEIKIFYFFALPKLTPDLNRVTVFQIKDNDVSKFNPLSFLAFGFNVAEIRLREGFRYKEVHIYDLKNLKVGHLLKFNPVVIKKLAEVMQKVYSHNIQSLNYINVPSFAYNFMYLLKVVLKEKVESRIIIHESLESLHKIVPKDILPEEFGGTFGSLKQLDEKWKQKFLEYDAIFRHLENINVDQDLLPEKLKIDETFGVHGNFKKLDVD